MAEFDTSLLSLQFEPHQPIEWNGRTLFFKGRARDGQATLIFEDLNGLPETMSPQQFLQRQMARQVRLLTPAEMAQATHRHSGGRPRVGLDSSDEEQDAESLADAQRKLRYLAAWERAGCPSRTDKCVGPIVRAVAEETGDNDPPCPRQFTKWIRNWLKFGRDPAMLVRQTPNCGNFTDKLPAKARQLLEEVAHEHYLTDQRLTVVAVYRQVQKTFASHNSTLPKADHLATPSLKTVYAQIKKIDAFTRDYCRLGKRVAEMRHRVLRSGPFTGAHHERWEIDHTTVNCLAVDGKTGEVIGRPTVTVILDCHTRMVMGFHISFDGPCTSAVMEAIRMAVLSKDKLLAQFPTIKNSWPVFGKCMVIVPDKGAEFRGAAFMEACLRLGMDPQYTPVLKPWYKGIIERFMRTLAVDVFHRVPGTVFSNFYERHQEATPEMTAVATLDELRFYVLQYIVDVYHQRNHRGRDKPPIQAWRESVAANGLLPPPNPDDLAADLASFEYRTIQREGIQYEGFHYRSPALAVLRVRANRPPVIKIKIDPLDMTQIWFIDPFDNRAKEAFIEESKAHQVKGVTWEKHRLARAIKRENPEEYDGEAGLAEAYAMLDDDMRKRTGASGKQNRQDAAAYFEKLMKAHEREEAPAFDMGRSSTSIVADAFADKSMTPASDEVVEGMSASMDVAPSAARATNDPKPRRSRKEKAPKPDSVTAPQKSQDASDEDDEFDPAEYARKHGLNIRERK